MRPLSLAALALAVCLAGCRVQTDLGVPCNLVKKDPADTDPSDGYSAVDVTESEVEPDRDYISFGQPFCEDFICVRDASFVPSANAKPTDPAIGYCSKACEQQAGDAPSVNEQCPPADPDAVKANAALQLNCRPLLLDPATITAICRDNAQVCEQYFGENRFSTFCARGGT